MAEVYYNVTKDQKTTNDQLKMIAEAAKLPIVYDDDCPEISPEKTPELYQALVDAVKERNRRLSAQKVKM